MAPRKTRATTAAQRLASSNSVTSTSVLRHLASAEKEEVKTEDPDSDPVLEQQTQTQTLRKSRERRATPSEDIFSPTFLSQAGRNLSTLSKRLKQMWQTLQHTSSRVQQQEDGVLDIRTCQKLQFMATELVQEQFVQHPDNHVRSLVACCLVEMLRVAAPDSPFDSQEALSRAFQLFIEQLQALRDGTSTKATELHHVHVLESLATAKTCVFAVDLVHLANEEKRVMVHLFETLFEVIEDKHSMKLEHLMLSLMRTCIEESGHVNAPLLDVMLHPLVRPKQTSTHPDNTIDHAAQMARSLIQRTSDVLQSPLAQYLNNLLVDTTGPSPLTPHVYRIIEQVHDITPSLVLHVLPNVCLQLQAEAVATRSNAITLMGKVFASSHAPRGHEQVKQFREFLGRFRDTSKAIRLQMIRASVAIWETNHAWAALIEQELILRLRDPEWEVRQLVVREVCDFAANCLDRVSRQCLCAVGERMKDKRVALRKETMTGLSQVFSTHIAAYWEEDEDEHGIMSLAHGSIPSENMEKLAWIPDYVLKCYAYPQEELKLRVIQLLDDFLLPKALTERTRANGLLFLYHSFDASSKEALRRLFHERATCHAVCATFVALKAHQRRQKRTDNRALNTATHELYTGLRPVFSNVVNLDKLLDKLAQWKDHSVFKHLRNLCDWTKSQRDMRRARDALVQSVGSKTALGEFLKLLCRKLSLLTMSRASVDCFVDFLVDKRGRCTRENRSIVDLLVMASKELPGLFDRMMCERVATLVVDNKDSRRDHAGESIVKDSNVMLGALHMLANYSKHWADTVGHGADATIEDSDDRTPSKDLAERLQGFCRGDCNVEVPHFSAAKQSRAAELAAFAIAHFYGNAKETLQLIKKLCSNEQVGSPTRTGVVPALLSLAVFAKHCRHHFSENQPLVARVWTLLLDHVIGTGEEGVASKTLKERTPKSKTLAAAKITEARCSAIKVLVNLLVYSTSESSEEALKLIKLLVAILRSEGKMFASTVAQAAMFRATASCGLMKMMRTRHLETLLSVADWQLLGLSIQDSSEEIRRHFLKKLTSHLVKQPLLHPHKYLSYLALVATDTSPSVKKEARQVLKIAVERMRRTFEAASESAHDSSLSALMVPEYALPYVIHLVAHHPKFPTNLVEKTPTVLVLQRAEWTDPLAYLEFFLDGLVSSKAAADNIAFVLQILTKLSHYHDVMAPNAIAMYPLIDSTAVVLKKKIKKQSDLKPYPGDIFVPKHLFGLGRPSSLATPGGRKEPEAPDSLGLRPSRQSASLSPIKPMDFAAHFMKLHSPPGSSLKSYRKKRKRSLLPINDEKEFDAEETTENNEDAPHVGTSSARRQSVLGQLRPDTRTFADDSSDSGAESDTIGRAPLSIASVQSGASCRAIADPIVEEKDETEGPRKKRGVATNE